MQRKRFYNGNVSEIKLNVHKREADNFKSREVKRLKECALALRWLLHRPLYLKCFYNIHVLQIGSEMNFQLIRYS